jgi:hypothetical protein
VICGAFAWSGTEAAHEVDMELAAKHGVGFFDVSAEQGDVCFPEPSGTLES